MLIQKIGERGVIFTYEDDITIYLIIGDHQYILCDTHLGPLSMNVIKEYITKRLPDKEIVVFNSHSDWDHIWGNCAFPGAKIIAHEMTRARMQEKGAFELDRLKELHKGEIELILPNLTYSDKLTLHDEGVEFIYAPGHTIDSSLCFDSRDSVLFVGDLVEAPIPYLDSSDLDGFIKTLELIKSFPAKTKLSAHSGIVSEELIERNIAYVDAIRLGHTITADMIESSGQVHQYNINNLLLLKYEPIIREKLGKTFNYSSFKTNFVDLGKVKFDDLRVALETYMQRLRATL